MANEEIHPSVPVVSLLEGPPPTASVTSVLAEKLQEKIPWAVLEADGVATLEEEGDYVVLSDAEFKRNMRLISETVGKLNPLVQCPNGRTVALVDRKNLSKLVEIPLSTDSANRIISACNSALSELGSADEARSSILSGLLPFTEHARLQLENMLHEKKANKLLYCHKTLQECLQHPYVFGEISIPVKIDSTGRAVQVRKETVAMVRIIESGFSQSSPVWDNPQRRHQSTFIVDDTNYYVIKSQSQAFAHLLNTVREQSLSH
jgi:hypothetical protein